MKLKASVSYSQAPIISSHVPLRKVHFNIISDLEGRWKLHEYLHNLL